MYHLCIYFFSLGILQVGKMFHGSAFLRGLPVNLAVYLRFTVQIKGLTVRLFKEYFNAHVKRLLPRNSSCVYHMDLLNLSYKHNSSPQPVFQISFTLLTTFMACCKKRAACNTNHSTQANRNPFVEEMLHHNKKIMPDENITALHFQKIGVEIKSRQTL